MPARQDISSVLVIGSGPIVIGQACEFDYSGVQACRVLKQEGYRVVLLNSNPATIMTDPEFADATYIEPLTPKILETVLRQERPDAVLPTIGGQTALNLARELDAAGTFKDVGTELIGANMDAIATAEDRELFKRSMLEIGMSVPPSGIARTPEEANDLLQELSLPVIIRPAYILGGKGATIAETTEEFHVAVRDGLAASPISEVLIETSIAGWKEYELEVMRDRADNCVIVCSIENFDPMGVHTGDSITVAPAMTLSDTEYQQMRNSAFACMRRVGVETGGSNVQFAVNPQDGRQYIIEMNPRVSRSSALASKATGFPIAKIAAKLAVGYTLDEIPNDITKATPACFEPAIDYVVTKIPRWAFEKFPDSQPKLGAAMQSVGEVMALGRTFPESLQKAVRSLELNRAGLNCDSQEELWHSRSVSELLEDMATPTPDRLFQIEAALSQGASVSEVCESTGIDPWFVGQIQDIARERQRFASLDFDKLEAADWRKARRMGFSDGQLAWLHNVSPAEASARRIASGTTPTYKTVDTCAAEFEAHTPYHYSTWEDSDEILPTDKPKVMILGAGPNRIGQGIEFDYCCVHASMALREDGYETLMVNCNPETVSTDYDTSDQLFFEPLTVSDVLSVLEVEKQLHEKTQSAGVVGIIISLGGQTPLKLAADLPAELVAGTSPDSIDKAEDRRQWAQLCQEQGIPQPPGATATDLSEAKAAAAEIGFPLLVRPSYVLGGRAMVIVHDEEALERTMVEIGATLRSEGGFNRPVLLDRFLENAVEVDVDAVRDYTGEVLIGGIMEHVESAGVHSGDSACVLPPQTLSEEVIATLEDYTVRIAEALDVKGPLNVQYGVVQSNKTQPAEQVYVIEANPRASRTLPFVAKATGVPLAKIAARVMMGATLREATSQDTILQKVASKKATPKKAILQDTRQTNQASAHAPAHEPAHTTTHASTHTPAYMTPHVSVKEAVLPFSRFPDSDTLLGPEMRSTGEVMGIDEDFPSAYLKAQLAAGSELPTEGVVLLHLPEFLSTEARELVEQFQELGFGVIGKKEIMATADGSNSAPAGHTNFVATGPPDFDSSDFNPPDFQLAVLVEDSEAMLRRLVASRNVPFISTLAAARAAIPAIRRLQGEPLRVRPLQQYHQYQQ